MERAVWAASSDSEGDSEDATTQEMNEEEWSPSNRDQRDSLNRAGEQSITKDAHGSVDLTFVKEAASPRNGRDSMGPVKAEAGKKPSDKGSQAVIHFEKKQEIKLSPPDNVGSTCTVNIFVEDGIPDCEPENIAMQWLSEEEDEEQVMVTQEDLAESAEELEFDSSTSTNGGSQKLNPGRSETQRKKRNLTEYGLGQASKLVKRLQHPQENQMPCASTDCGESASGPSCSQLNESFQSKHLEENCATEKPVNCAESKEMLSHSSESVDYQKVHTGKGKYHCTECNTTCRNTALLDKHFLSNHSNLARKPFKCPECNKRFVTGDGMSEHQLTCHNGEKPFQCTECNLTCRDAVRLDRHRLMNHGNLALKPFKCPECNKRFVSGDAMSEHQRSLHNVEKPFQCTECSLKLNSLLLLNEHHLKAHNRKKPFKCPECNKQFGTADGMSEHRLMIHNVDKPFKCTECNLTFNSLLLLDEHRDTAHGLKKRFKCRRCNIRFETADELSDHRFRFHNVENFIQCRECNITFSSLMLLNLHCVTAHNTEKPFKCLDCNKRFGTADGMSEHRLGSHNVETPFECAECNLTFNRLLLLNEHRRTVHNTEKPFKCPEVLFNSKWHERPSAYDP